MILFLEIIFYISIILNVYFFFFHSTSPLSEKLGMVLKIVGLYTFAFGVLTQTGLLSGIAEDMASANVYKFLRGNALMMSLGSSACALMMDPSNTTVSAFSFLEMYVLLPIVLPIMIIYFVFHWFVIMPLTYVAYVLATLPVGAITSTMSDYGLSISSPNEPSTTIMVKELVSQHTIAIKNFIISFSSLGLALILSLYEFYNTNKNPRRLNNLWPQWFVRHYRTFMPRAIAIGSISLQAIIYLFIFIGIILGVSMPSLTPPAAVGEPNVMGEIIGVEIVLILIVTTLVCQARNIRRYRLAQKATDLERDKVIDSSKKEE